jgi:hypothetical protein
MKSELVPIPVEHVVLHCLPVTPSLIPDADGRVFMNPWQKIP